MMSAYFARVCPTYIENWSPALWALSIPQSDLPLGCTEARALGVGNKAFRQWFGNGAIPPIKGIAERIDVVLRDYPDGAFVRLGSGSAKDSSYARNRGLRVTNSDAAIRMLTSDSHRIAYDLRLALCQDYLPHIFVRQWLRFPSWSEFRCFMKNRRLVGISQYHYKEKSRNPQIANLAGQIEAAIRNFFEAVRIASHLDDVVCDVVVTVGETNGEGPIRVRLLELNPFFHRTDPCLFDWRNGGNFDGTFRFL